jgi:hypothetical protein
MRNLRFIFVSLRQPLLSVLLISFSGCTKDDSDGKSANTDSADIALYYRAAPDRQVAVKW